MQQKAAAADAAQPGLDAGQHQRGHHRRIHGIAALCQHPGTGAGGLVMLAGDDAAL